MNLCKSGHEPICYGESYCPLCELNIEKDEVESELKDAQEEIATLKDEIFELKERLKPEREPEHEKGD